MIKKFLRALCVTSLVISTCTAARRAPAPERDDYYTCPAKACGIITITGFLALWLASTPIDHISLAERDIKHGTPVDDARLSMLMADCDLRGDTSVPNLCARAHPLVWQRYNALREAFELEKAPLLSLAPPVTPAEAAYIKAFNSGLINLYTVTDRIIDDYAQFVSASNSSHTPTLKSVQKLGEKILKRFDNLHKCVRGTSRTPCQEAHIALLQRYLLKATVGPTTYTDANVCDTLYMLLPISDPRPPRDFLEIYASDSVKAIIAQVDCIERMFQQLEKEIHEAMARAVQQLALLPSNTTNHTLVDVLEDGAKEESAQRRRHEQEVQKQALKRCYKNLYS